MAAAIARRWRCYEALILLGSKMSICWLLFFFFFPGFLVDYGCGSMGFDLDRIVFFLGSLVGFNDLAANWVGDDLA